MDELNMEKGAKERVEMKSHVLTVVSDFIFRSI